MTERADIRVFVVQSPTGLGRGVFAAQAIPAGKVIERCPVLIVPLKERHYLDQTSLYDYYFIWAGEDAAFALGCGSLYNHSFRPNGRYDQDAEAMELVFTALEDIPAGDEIFVNYNGEPRLQDSLWFEAIEPRSTEPDPPIEDCAQRK